MTCIVGIVGDDGIVYLGGDSAGGNVDTYAITDRKDPKVFNKGPYIIGYTSSFRMGQILMYNWKAPDHPVGMEDFEFMVSKFTESVRSCFKEFGYSTCENNKERAGDFIVGYRGQLYIVESDYQIAMTHDSFMSVGSGRELATGAMHALEHLESKVKLTPQEKLTIALSAPTKFSAYVRGPFVIVKTEPYTKEIQLLERTV
jgi:hypothetical protein